MATDLHVSTSSRGSWTVVRAEGEIDIASVDTLESEIARVVEDGQTRVAVELSPVSFMDSTGLRALISSHHQLAERGGELALVVSDGPVRRLLEVSGLVGNLPVYPTLEDLDGS